MRKVLLFLVGLFVTVNCFAFETQTAVENSAAATSVIQETGASVELLTVWVAKECLVCIVKNMGKPCDVFNWDDDKAEEVSAVVDDYYCLVLLGRDCDKLENEYALTFTNITIFIEDVATLVETFGFDENNALDIAVKTLTDITEKYRE